MKLKDAQFCPFCGCQSLERDKYREEHGKGYAGRPPEFLCHTCNRGFCIIPSLRHEQANILFKVHRQMRQGKD